MTAFITAPFAALARLHPLRPAAAARPRTRLPGAFAGLALVSAAATLLQPWPARCDEAKRACSTSSTGTETAGAAMATLSDLGTLKDISGADIPPATFSGKVVFAINVASACGYTQSGYDLLARLTDKYPPDQFVAVAIPCNSFGWQENGSPEEISAFALARAQRLVVTERSNVNGNDAHPIVKLAKERFPGRVNWNFDGRYVFDRQGVPVARFGNGAGVDEIEAAIDKAM